MRLKLAIEPVPVSTWGKSLANLLPKKEWDKIRHESYKEANYECEVCGEVNLTLHCHEKWIWNNRSRIQRLVGIEVCCELCHSVHHFGRSQEVRSKQYVERLVAHWCKINEKTKRDFKLHQLQIFEINKKRANIYYQVKVGRRILA